MIFDRLGRPRRSIQLKKIKGELNFMINRVILVGRLTRNPELRYTTNSNIAVSTFAIAVNRKFTNKHGEREADFINIVTWRNLAQNCANYLRKGSLVGIEGRIQTRNYENQEGKTVYVTEVVADDVRFLDSRSRNVDSSQNQINTDDMGKMSVGSLSISDQDLPF